MTVVLVRSVPDSTVVHVVVLDPLDVLFINLRASGLPEYVQQPTSVDNVPNFLAAEPTVKEHLVNFHVAGSLL